MQIYGIKFSKLTTTADLQCRYAELKKSHPWNNLNSDSVNQTTKQAYIRYHNIYSLQRLTQQNIIDTPIAACIVTTVFGILQHSLKKHFILVTEKNCV